MPFTVTENQFKEAFKEFGRILECVLHQESGKSRGQGYILFEKQEEAKETVRVMDQAKFNDRVVLVKEDDSVFKEQSRGSERHEERRGNERGHSDRSFNDRGNSNRQWR
jgi:RNA recognition motif-containing protein